MNNLTLIIPAKKEKESLPQVLYELKEYKLNILVILEESDRETIESINNFDCKIIYQSKKGYGNALIEGINKVDTKYFCIFNAEGVMDFTRSAIAFLPAGRQVRNNDFLLSY